MVEKDTGRVARLSLIFMLVVLGWRLVLIACFGNATPSWDQWDAEASRLYLPWLQGSLDWRQLIAPFNEHRLFCTRLLDLLLLEANGGIWNCLLQMVVDCLLHVLGLGCLVFGLLGACPPARRPLFLILALVLFCIPFGQENLLWGFQSQFYFLLLFSLLFLTGIALLEPFSPRWWLSLLAGPLSVLSLASGVLTLATGALLMALRWWAGGRRGYGVPLVATTLLGLALFAFHSTPSTWLGNVYRAHSLEQLLDALNRTASWPFLPWSCLVIYLPLARTAWGWLRQPPPPGSPDWFLLGLALWQLGQLFGIAYGRAVIVESSRYQDILVVGLLLNGLCLLRQYAPIPGGGLRSRYRFYMLWLVLVGLGTGLEIPEMNRHIAYRAESAAAQEVKLRDWLAGGRQAVLQGRPAYDIPYPDAGGLQQILAHAEIRQILPGNLLPGHEQRQPLLIRLLLAHLAMIGTALVLLGVGLAWRGRRAATPVGA